MKMSPPPIARTARQEGVGGEECRAVRADTKRGQSRRPARSEQNPAKKFSFPFRRRNRARAHQENRRKLFCWVASASERRRAGFLISVQSRFVQSSEYPTNTELNGFFKARRWDARSASH